MTDELKPVRCGCEGEASCYLTHYWGKCFTVQCSECGIETKPYDTEAEAITAWNRAMSGNVQECAENARCTEQTAKVNELCGKWGKCECGADIFHPDTEGWKYCPYCGARLEWK